MATRDNARESKRGETRRKIGARGFASMEAEKQREIARKGGQVAHAKGRAHEFTVEEAREAGRKGGQRVSRNRQHMAEIGRKGGQTVSQDRQHMAEIGRKGGRRRSTDGNPGKRSQ
ncbi:MAG: KGG domain-containing protein [Candidatus Competibacteraceae bacterium]